MTMTPTPHTVHAGDAGTAGSTHPVSLCRRPTPYWRRRRPPAPESKGGRSSAQSVGPGGSSARGRPLVPGSPRARRAGHDGVTDSSTLVGRRCRGAAAARVLAHGLSDRRRTGSPGSWLSIREVRRSARPRAATSSARSDSQAAPEPMRTARRPGRTERGPTQTPQEISLSGVLQLRGAVSIAAGYGTRTTFPWVWPRSSSRNASRTCCSG
jgi:hypothetical protein